MEKQTLDQIIQQSTLAENSESDFYSDVTLKILLRTMTPVTVPASFEQSVLNKVALLEPVKLYKSIVVATSFYALMSIFLVSFSSLINFEILSNQSSDIKKQFVVPQETQQNKSEFNSSPSLSKTIDKQVSAEESVVIKKKNIKRKNTNKSTQTPIPPPPKGIE
jgi:hypothetical protein